MKTILIIDGAYMLHGSKLHGKMDYLKLKTFIESTISAKIDSGYYLNSVPDPATEGQNAFHSWLRSAAPTGPNLRVQLYDLKKMNVKCDSCGNEFERTVQKGVDVGIATLILKFGLLNRYDQLILCAGDGDFVDAIKYITEEQNKEFIMCGFDPSMSTEMQSYSKKVISLTKNWNSIEKI